MRRSSWFSFAYALMIGAAGPLAACASNENQANASEATTATAAADQTQIQSGYSDAQVQAFVAARGEIQQLTPGQTVEQQAQNQQRISEILQRHGIAPDTYNSIQSAAQTDQALANRIAAASVGTSLSDAQLQAFVAASAEIEPLNRAIASAPEDQRAAIGAQIVAALERHNLDVETYNGIAARAQADQELASRIAQLRAAQSEG